MFKGNPEKDVANTEVMPAVTGALQHHEHDSGEASRGEQAAASGTAFHEIHELKQDLKPEHLSNAPEGHESNSKYKSFLLQQLEEDTSEDMGTEQLSKRNANHGHGLPVEEDESTDLVEIDGNNQTTELSATSTSAPEAGELPQSRTDGFSTELQDGGGSGGSASTTGPNEIESNDQHALKHQPADCALIEEAAQHGHLVAQMQLQQQQLINQLQLTAWEQSNNSHEDHEQAAAASTSRQSSPGNQFLLPPSMTGLPEKAYEFVERALKAINVEVEQGPGIPYRMVRVILDYHDIEAKRMLGGYRNKKTEKVYHHAETQTPKPKKYANANPKYTRETQTKQMKTRTQQTFREAAMQMIRPGVLLNEEHDREYFPGPYFTADQLMELKVLATITIQRFTRGWFARKRALRLQKMKYEREEFLLEQELKQQEEAEHQRSKEIERRIHPRSAADFEVLYNELEAWRLQETRRIKEGKLPAPKQQIALRQLLHKETKLLQTIDRLKIAANLENKDQRIDRTLKDMAKPKTWDLKNGAKAEVHTPHTTRAQELMQLYKGLNMPQLSLEERLDVLLHVKWTVKEFDCNLTREIVELIEREADLLNRGRDPKTLQGLRKRISSLFLAFIETPEFNPEATRFQIVPVDFQENFVYERVETSTARAKAVQ